MLLQINKLMNIKLKGPFLTKILNENYFSEDIILLNDELNNVSIFSEKDRNTDLRKYDNKNKISTILKKTDFDSLKDINLIIVSYDFKRNDKLTNFLNELTNAVLFSCYEEDTVDIKS